MILFSVTTRHIFVYTSKGMKRILFPVILVSAVISMAFVSVLSSNGIAARCGSPGESTCTSCHGNASTGSISIDLPVSLQGGLPYALGQTYTLSATVNENGKSLFGFCLEALDGTGANGGNLISGGTDVKALTATVAGKSRKCMTHTGNGNNTANTHSFTFTWTAPATNVGNVTIYMAGLAANGDGNASSQDHTYTANVIIPAPPAASMPSSESESFSFTLFPNPTERNRVQLNCFMRENQPAKVYLRSSDGRLIRVNSYDLSAGPQTIDLNLSDLNLNTGLYFVEFELNGIFTSRRPLIIQ